MKNSEKKSLTEKDKKELKTMLKETKGDLAKVVLDKNTGKLKNLRLLFQKRKDIARILTVIRQKELEHA